MVIVSKIMLNVKMSRSCFDKCIKNFVNDFIMCDSIILYVCVCLCKRGCHLKLLNRLIFLNRFFEEVARQTEINDSEN